MPHGPQERGAGRDGGNMKLEVARKYAEDCRRWLAPFCERIEIAGSVRRGKAECADVDLVAIARVTGEKNLFEETLATRNLLKEELERYVRNNQDRGVRWLTGKGGEGRGPVGTEATTNFLINLPKCELNVFCAQSDENFGAVWLTYTGSKEGNIWMIGRAKELGMKWSAKRGVERGAGSGEWVGRTEEEIYGALGMSWVQPSEREPAYLTTKITKGTKI